MDEDTFFQQEIGWSIQEMDADIHDEDDSEEEKRPHGEWKTESAIDYLTEIGWLPEHDRILTERPHGNWEYLKEHITEMSDADGELNQKQTCKFILELMGVIEREGEAE